MSAARERKPLAAFRERREIPRRKTLARGKFRRGGVAKRANTYLRRAVCMYIRQIEEFNFARNIRREEACKSDIFVSGAATPRT